MPHVCVQINPGKAESQKQQLADAIVNDFIELFGYGEEAVLVAITEVGPVDWKKKFISQRLWISRRRFTKARLHHVI